MHFGQIWQLCSTLCSGVISHAAVFVSVRACVCVRLRERRGARRVAGGRLYSITLSSSWTNISQHVCVRRQDRLHSLQASLHVDVPAFQPSQSGWITASTVCYGGAAVVMAQVSLFNFSSLKCLCATFSGLQGIKASAA